MTIPFRARARQRRHAYTVRACDNAFLLGFSAGATFIIILHGLSGGALPNTDEGTAKVLPFQPRRAPAYALTAPRQNQAGLRLVAAGGTR